MAKPFSFDKGDPWVDFVVYLPAVVEERDQPLVLQALNEMFFGQDRLAPHVEELVKGKVDAKKVQALLVEDRLATRDSASNPHLELMASQKNISLDSGGLFRILLGNPRSDGMLKFTSGVKAADGRKSVFVTVRPMRGFTVTNELDLTLLMQATVGSCATAELPDTVVEYLEQSGVRVQQLTEQDRSPLTRLSPESRAALEKYGMREHEFGGISVMLDPQFSRHHASTQLFLRQQKLGLADFAIHDQKIQ